MKITKRALTTLNSCYAVSSMSINGIPNILLASEAEAPCLAWAGPDYDTSPQVVWEGPGGVMSIVAIPGTDGEFLAVQKFFNMDVQEIAKVVHVRPLSNGQFEVTDILQLPYIHRIDLLTVNGRHYFIGCTLSTHKESLADWSHAGQLWVGEYTGPGPLAVSLLKDGLTKNHGYSRLVQGGAMSGLVTCEEGAFEVKPPAVPGGQWSVTQFMDWPISDISTVDIDGDGELEYATIESFHGSYFRIYKKVAGKFVMIFEHPEVTEFYHVVVGATLAGRPVFIGGCRRGKQQLFYVAPSAEDPLRLHAVLIDEGVGPSNACVVHQDGRDIIAVANRETNEAALYFVE